METTEVEFFSKNVQAAVSVTFPEMNSTVDIFLRSFWRQKQHFLFCFKIGQNNFSYMCGSQKEPSFVSSVCYSSSVNDNFKETFYTLFLVNNQRFKQSPRKSLICQTISKQFGGANKRRKLNNPLQEQAKTLFLHRKSKRNAHFWTCQFKSVHYIL